jgi:triosephosphate isomerase
MHPRRLLIGGNWKMNGDLAGGVELAEAVVAAFDPLNESVDAVIFPPFPYLQAIGRVLGHSGIRLGAQDCSSEANGAFTGDVSAEMLVDLGVSQVIIGHSERRPYFIDHKGVHCAVGYLMLASGNNKLALQIQKEQNFFT